MAHNYYMEKGLQIALMNIFAIKLLKWIKSFDTVIDYPQIIIDHKLELTESIGVRELIEELIKIKLSKSSGLTEVSTKILKLSVLATPRIFFI